MRWGAFTRAKDWIQRMCRDHKNRPRRLGVGGWLCVVAKVAGTVLFGASCCAVFLPFILGFTWVEAAIVLCTGLLMSFPLIFFQALYLEVEGFVLMLWAWFKGMTVTEYADRFEKASN